MLNPTNITEMYDVIIHNIDLCINKAIYEQPNGWQFKNRTYMKCKEILSRNKELIRKASKQMKNLKITIDFYEDLFKRNKFKSNSIIKKLTTLYSTYFTRITAGGGTEDNELILKEVREFAKSPIANAINRFNNIYGVGPAKIRTLLSKNIYTLEQLKDALNNEPKLLNNKQKMGLRHYEDLNERIPRNEITMFNTFAMKLITANYGNDISMIIAGSYRRGVKTSGDIDMLITSHKYEGKALDMVLKLLVDNNIVYENLAKGKKKFMGVIKVTPQHKARHLDIIETSPQDYPFAISYFTGNAQHNVQLRIKALSLGYSLNESNMTIKGTKTLVPTNKIREKIGKDKYETEEDIYNFLDMEYVEPTKRNK
jgi:DNA polymerase/3'-5' exonuclease PolX